MSILIDFVNVRHWDSDAIGDIYRKYGLIHTKAGESQGYEPFCATSLSKDKMFYFELGGESLHASLKESGAGNENPVILPDDPQMSELYGYLKQRQLDYRDFLDACMRGKLNITFIQSRSYMLLKPFISAGDKEWYPTCELHPEHCSTIEEYIDCYEIIIPLLRMEGEKFSRVTRCKHCGNYFFAKSKKAKFCSDECRNSNFYKTEPKGGKLLSFFL